MSLSHHESPPIENRLDHLRGIIQNAQRSIAGEFARTVNSWLECFGSCVFQVETYLASSKVRVVLSPEKYTIAEKRLEDLKEKLHHLKEQYPNKQPVPPENIQQELLAELDILR